MTSNAFKSLSGNVKALRQQFLPKRFKITGNYDDRVFVGVVAFRVLSHGALEEYFEARATELARMAHVSYRDTGRMSVTAGCLIAFSGGEMRLPPETIDAPQPTKAANWASEIDIMQRVGACASKYIARVKNDNHGVRERNLLSILLPIGIRHDKIDRLLISELDNFGRIRGEYAHSGVVTHVRRRPDPKDELLKVRKIIELIRTIDIEFDLLLAQLK